VGKKDKIVLDAQALAVDGKLNLTDVRHLHKSLYSKITTVFESVDDFKKAIQPIECVYTKQRKPYKQRFDKHYPVVDLSLRNLLAFEKMTELREENPLERIAEKYGVSRQAVHQLEEALREAQKHRVDVSSFQNYNQNTTY
jgi:hypothetical protein